MLTDAIAEKSCQFFTPPLCCCQQKPTRTGTQRHHYMETWQRFQPIARALLDCVAKSSSIHTYSCVCMWSLFTHTAVGTEFTHTWYADWIQLSVMCKQVNTFLFTGFKTHAKKKCVVIPQWACSLELYFILPGQKTSESWNIFIVCSRLFSKKV